jgi:hypothetical protein
VLLAALALATVTAAGAAAQDDGAAFGLKGGLSLASFRGDGASYESRDQVLDPGRRTGIVVGAFVALPVGRTVAIQPEALYVQKGATYTAAPGAELLYQVDYLEVPLLLKLRLGSGSTRGALLAGPAAGFRLNGTVIARSPGEEESTADVSDMLRSVDWGLVLGAGVDFAAGSGALGLEARYTWGLTDLGKEPGPGQTRGSFNPRNGVLSLLVGYAF